MYTVDTSVWLGAFDYTRSQHATCLAVLDTLAALGQPIYVPTLLLAEVASAISRSRNDPIQGRVFAATLHNVAHLRFVSLDESLAERAAEIAADYRLRGADAVYVAVAMLQHCTLISLDDEQRTRVASLLTTQTPAEALAVLKSLDQYLATKASRRHAPAGGSIANPKPDYPTSDSL